MIELGELGRVLFLISWWLANIKCHKAIGFLDINKVSENLSLKLLNEIYDYKLVNLNDNQKDYPGIDLGDKDKKIAFQITSKKSTRKIKKDPGTFLKESLTDYSNGIRFLILTQDKKPQLSKDKLTDLCRDFDFDPDQHILTASDLIKEIQKIYKTDNERFYKIKEILEVEIAGKAMEKEIKKVAFSEFIKIDHSTENDELLGPKVILPDIINNLALKIINDLDDVDIKASYIKSGHPEGGLPQMITEKAETAPIDLFMECCYNLSKATKQGESELYPLLIFLKNISTQLVGGPQKAVNKFLRTAHKKLYKNKSERRLAWKRLTRRRSNKLHINKDKKNFLMIRLNPDLRKPKTFRVDIWLFGTMRKKPLYTGKRLRLKEIKGFLYDFIDEVVNRERIDYSTLCIEFFLPRKHITEPVDQWEIKRAMAGPGKIGRECRVFVRSKERTEYYQGYASLKRRWDSLENNCECFKVSEFPKNNNESHVACWIDFYKYDCDKIENILRKDCQLGCILMKNEPIPAEAGDTDVLNSILHFGIPIVIWPRSVPHLTEKEIKNELNKVVEKSNLSELPNSIWELRQKSGNCLSDNVTLLLDNPDRLPPDSYLFSNPQ